MFNHLSAKINIELFIILGLGIALLSSCGGGGGGGGSSSSSSTVSSSSSSTPAFTIATIDSTGDVGWSSSIAIGSIHISYYDNTNKCLKYAYNNGSSWSIVNVDNTADVGYYSSLAVESDGTVHIGYYDYDSNFLKYATCSGAADCTESSNWINGVIIDSSSDVGSYPSIAVESDGTIHIGYYDFDNGSLKYATCSGATDCTDDANWNYVTTANMGAYIGIDPRVISLAIDSSSNIHIVYYDSTSSSLKHVSGTYASFSDPGYDPDNAPESVDASGDVGTGLSLAIDTSDNLHISYYDSTNDCLKYAVGTSGSFASEIVDSSTSVGEFCSIGVESDGTVHISYYDYIDTSNGYLKYAVK